LDND
jgi:hypothetical protein